MTQPPTLNLDQPLMLLALQEAIQNLRQLRSLLLAHGQSLHLDLCHGALLRLTYYALRCPDLQPQTADLLALHRLSQDALAARLHSLPRFQDQLRHQSRA